MNINHNYDIYNRKEPSIIYLASPGKNVLCAINGIDSSSVSLEINTNNTTTLSFSVNKYITKDIISNAYDSIEELMELYCDGIWFKIVDPPSISYDGLQETKEVTAESYEITLSQYMLNDFKINVGDESSYNMIYKRNYDLNHEKNPNHDPDFDSGEYFSVTFYNPDCPDLSLLHLVLKHAGLENIWHIGYVDDTLSQDNTLSDEELNDPNLPSRYLRNASYYYEVDNKSVYTFLTQEVSSSCRCIFEFDTVNMTINAYRPEGIGKDTELFLSFRNIQNNISVSRNTSLITQFYVSGANGYNIDSVNFGDSVITDISYFVNDSYMSRDLQEKYKRYIAYKENKRNGYVVNSKIYNYINEKLTELRDRVPIDHVKNDWFSCSVKDLKSAYNSNTAIILGLEQLYVDYDNNFSIEELKKSESDWELYRSIMDYTLPAIIAALHSKGDDGATNITELNKIYENSDDNKLNKKQFKITGNGNLLSNVNPVIINTDWITINRPYTKCSTEDMHIDLPQCSGITRGFKFSNTYVPSDDEDDTGPAIGEMQHVPVSNTYDSFFQGYGIVQQKINVNVNSYYCLSCYVKLSKSSIKNKLSLSYAKSSSVYMNQRRLAKEFEITQANEWVKYSLFFKNEDLTLIDVAFILYNHENTIKYTTYLPFYICGMQLEEISQTDYENQTLNTSFGYFIETESSIKSYETDWDLYGIDELNTKIKVYNNCLSELKKKGFNTDSTYDLNCGKDYSAQMKQCYDDYSILLEQATAALSKRQAEYDTLLNGPVKDIDIGDTTVNENNETVPILYTAPKGMNGINNERRFLIKDVDINNWGKNWENEYDVDLKNNYEYLCTKLSESELKKELFTEEELKILLLLYRQALYTNDNIEVTSIDTSVTAINQVYNLFADATKELYIESHPQYTYTDTIENIYALPELKEYHSKFNVNDFVHVELNNNTFITLRLIKISYNPCDLDQSMQITFSNMIQYSSKRNDYNLLLDGMLTSSSHDAGEIKGKSNNGSNYVVSADIMQQLLSNPLFVSRLTTSSANNPSADTTNLQKQIESLQKQINELKASMTS